MTVVPNQMRPWFNVVQNNCAQDTHLPNFHSPNITLLSTQSVLHTMIYNLFNAYQILNENAVVHLIVGQPM